MDRCLLICFLALTSPVGRGAAADLPEGLGLAARYPRDVGIQEDPAVLLAEDFEAGTVAQVAKRWGDSRNPDGRALKLVADGPKGAETGRALQITATVPRDTGGHLYTRLGGGVDTAFARFYVKFPAGGAYIHHFVHLGGYRPATAWPQGGAGNRPRGDERITVGIEPHGQSGRHPAPGLWNFYAYWHEMKISADKRYWGNGLQPVQDQLAPRNRWQCVEIMLQLNTPGKHDGELALWLDGRRVAHFAPGARRDRWTGMGFRLRTAGGERFSGFNWRTDERLKVNFFWLLHYVTEASQRRNRIKPPWPPNRVWFDNVVVARQYIGPMVSKTVQP